MIIFLATLFERYTSKSLEIADDSLQNYCDNKMINQFVLSYSSFGKNSWESFGENIEKVAKRALSSSLYNKWRVRIYHDLYPPEFRAEIH